jgi:hypothetical protein
LYSKNFGSVNWSVPLQGSIRGGCATAAPRVQCDTTLGIHCIYVSASACRRARTCPFVLVLVRADTEQYLGSLPIHGMDPTPARVCAFGSSYALDPYLYVIHDPAALDWRRLAGLDIWRRLVPFMFAFVVWVRPVSLPPVMALFGRTTEWEPLVGGSQFPLPTLGSSTREYLYRSISRGLYMYSEGA